MKLKDFILHHVSHLETKQAFNCRNCFSLRLHICCTWFIVVVDSKGESGLLDVDTVAVCHSPFPEVAESVQEELDAYRAQEDEVKRLKSIMVRR